MHGKTFGLITTEDSWYVIDAEPHVMSRIRVIFDVSRPYVRHPGKYTHKPVYVPQTLSASRDLQWLCSRYPMEMDETTAEKIALFAHEYDAVCAAVSDADKDSSFVLSDKAWRMAYPLRDYQAQFRNMWLKVKRTLLGDVMGLGKTVSAMSALCEPEMRPALVVTPTHLCAQWEREFARFLPESRTHIIKGHKNYPLPGADVYITAYSRLSPWQDVLAGEKKFTTVIFDEVHELRRVHTDKRDTARAISLRADMVAGLSGTPIINYGQEIWSVLDVIAPDRLGSAEGFAREWCLDQRVREPAILHSYLKSQGLFLRRETKDVGLTAGTATKHVYTIDADMEKLREVQDVAKLLALSVLQGNISSEEKWSDSARELDWKLRHATGVAKARPVAEFVRLMVEQGEKVVLAGWHHEVYDVWLNELSAFNPVKFTGTETPAQKDAAFKKFVEDDSCRIFVMSLRSGAGIDGLQHVCSTVVFGELDWSPHMMDQLLMRVHRQGQTKHVQAFYLTIADGADPFMLSVLNIKRSQHDGLVEGKEGEGAVLENVGYDKNRVRDMAAAYLKSIGEDIPEQLPEEGLLAEVTAALKRIRVPVNTEKEMQSALSQVLPNVLPSGATLEREVRVGKKSRLDFLVIRGDDRVAIECKVDSTKRADVYRQVRRYAKEASISGLALFAPWGGVPGFVVDGVPVSVVDYSAASL